MKQKQAGFGAVEVLLIVVTIALIGALGWIFFTNNSDSSNDNADTNQTEARDSDERDNPDGDTNEIAEDPNEGYFVVQEWGLRFTVPEGLEQVQYAINGDTLAFFAIPSGSGWSYADDFNAIEGGFFKHSPAGTVQREASATSDLGVRGVHENTLVGDHYYSSAFSFSPRATGYGCSPSVYTLEGTDEQCAAINRVHELVNRGDDSLIGSIEVAE